MVEAGNNQESLTEVNKVQRQIIVICGPEGSGKTTQAKLLSEVWNLPHVAMGDVFRELSKEDSDLGKKSRQLFEKHTYSDISLFREAFVWRMKKEDVKNGFVLDGAFRFPDEVEYFASLLREVGLSGDIPIKVVYYRVPGWMAAERLLERRRDDDTVDGILSRLSHHYSRLGERMSNARRIWPFIIINAFGKSVEELSRETKEQISSKAQARVKT